MSGECPVADLDPVGVSLVAGYPRLTRYLGSSCRLVTCGGHAGAAWTIEARGFTTLRGSAITDGRRVVIVAGTG